MKYVACSDRAAGLDGVLSLESVGGLKVGSGRRPKPYLSHRSVRFLLLAGCCAATSAACTNAGRNWFSRGSAATATEASPPLESSDTGWTEPPESGPHAPSAAQRPATALELVVIHIQIPSEDVPRVAKIWNYLREDVLTAETQLRLRQNGLRVGIGHADSWAPIKTAMDVIAGHRVLLAQPLQVPAGFPLALELDEEPRDQTLFWVEQDGLLSGATWPESRNVLRVTYGPDPQYPDRARIYAAPEVRQRLKGLRYIRTESGLWQVPKQYMRAFTAAGFTVTLAPDEFLLVTRDGAARTAGLLGDEFLSSQAEGTRYDSYVFLRPEVKRAD